MVDIQSQVVADVAAAVDGATAAAAVVDYTAFVAAAKKERANK